MIYLVQVELCSPKFQCLFMLLPPVTTWIPLWFLIQVAVRFSSFITASTLRIPASFPTRAIGIGVFLLLVPIRQGVAERFGLHRLPIHTRIHLTRGSGRLGLMLTVEQCFACGIGTTARRQAGVSGMGEILALTLVRVGR